MTSPRRMRRRQALGAVASLAGLGLGSGCARSGGELPEARSAAGEATAPSSSPQLFSLEQARLVDALADWLLPGVRAPRATAVGVPAFIESMLRDVWEREQAAGFLSELDRVGRDAEARFGAPLWRLSEADRGRAVSAEIERTLLAVERGDRGPHFWRQFRALALRGYCRSRPVAEGLLGYVASPGPYVGCLPASPG